MTIEEIKTAGGYYLIGKEGIWSFYYLHNEIKNKDTILLDSVSVRTYGDMMIYLPADFIPISRHVIGP